MDKDTLSNYGWMLITMMTVVIFIMIAQPLGRYISSVITGTGNGIVAVGDTVDISDSEKDMEELFDDEQGHNNISIKGE